MKPLDVFGPRENLQTQRARLARLAKGQPVVSPSRIPTPNVNVGSFMLPEPWAVSRAGLDLAVLFAS